MDKLIISESFNNSDMYYATGVLVPDQFVYISIDNEEFVIVNKLEFSRVKRDVRDGIKVILQKESIEKDVLDFLQKRKISVSYDFPVKYADFFRENGVEIKPTILFKERMIKTEEEIEKIIQTQKVVEKAYDRAVELIEISDVKEGILYFEGEKLTSEKIKEEINIIFIKNQIEATDIIVSCGPSSAHPHDLGKGEILAGEPIILDIYSRSILTRYHSDMTRTVCKGEPNNPKVQEMYNIVLEAQEVGFSKIKDGVSVEEVHNEVVGIFKKYGMDEYFIHGTGHGVGLDIHEEPRISTGGGKLKEGMVLTNEPGLYIPNIGGIRIEDTFVVTKDGYRNLATSQKKFVI